MTSRERVLAAVNHQRPDRTPFDLGGSRVTGISVFAYHELCRHVGLQLDPPKVYDLFQMLAEVEEPFRQRFGIDVAPVHQYRPAFGLRIDEWKPWTLWNGVEVQVPVDFSPETAANGDILIRDAQSPDGPHVARMPRNGFYFDGIGSTGMSAKLELPDADEYAKSLRPLADEELSFAAKQARELYDTTEYALLGEFWAGGLWPPLGFGDAMVALATEPNWCAEVLAAQADNAIESAKLYHQAVGDRCVAWLVCGHDYGTQRKELFRPELFADLFAPSFRRINDWLHEHTTAKTFYHTCGCNRALIPTFIEMGVDILNPVQVTAEGMDAEELAAEFGGRIVFWGGGVNTQSTLPHGTPEEVREQARERCRVFGENGGFVFAAIHNVQAGTPAGNLVAMAEGVRSSSESVSSRDVWCEALGRNGSADL